MKRDMEDSRTFTAKYPGRCATCPEEIWVDDLVRYSEDRLVHAQCPDVPAYGTESQVPPCERCFQVPAANGACGCDD